MKEKELNLAKILEDCLAGTRLYSPLYGEVTFACVTKENNICVHDCHDCLEIFFSNGKANNCPGECMLFPSKENRDWSTWENSGIECFTPKMLKPLDKVLVRRTNDDRWLPTMFGYYDNCFKKVMTIADQTYAQAIPYGDDTKHLVGTTDEAPKYYHYWED